ncbi:unnamed protein product [Rhizoctonia solani]|uniref:Uncharacterized protein n=1 Tax=Rhizoctonia solani TaxID=456999 RepID=A0A8H3CQ14_9AGAM|nr:unnamed protein product [Rhizoctonia solani]
MASRRIYRASTFGKLIYSLKSNTVCNMTNSPLKHIVFLPGISWGHVRPGLKTSLRMLEKFEDLFISVFIPESEVPKAQKYLDAQPCAYLNRIKIIVASTNGESAFVTLVSSLLNILIQLEKLFELWITKELQHTTELQIEGRLVGKPSWIIEDQQTGGVSLASKHIHNLPVVSWWSTTAASLISRHGNEENGHGGRVFEDISERQDFSFAKTGEVYLQEVSGRLVCIPGVPLHHEWELIPQYIPSILSLIAPVHGRGANMIKSVDMVVCCATFEMAPITSSALSNAFGKPITPFLIGPSVDLKSSPSPPDSDSTVTDFLDRAYTEKGAHSVIYIAFRTFFFPAPDSISHLTAILDEITNSGLRFILALSNMNARLDEPWMDAQVRVGNAIFPKWTNQTAVLDHLAIHYFLSHGGWNSCTEGLVRGVPMIFWPFSSDQPTNAMQIATVHDCGFELLQVRTGPAKSTAYQNGQEVKIVGTDDAVRKEIKQVLEFSRGPRGEHQRTNARWLGKVIADSLERGRSGDLNLERFGKALGLA